MSHIIDNTAANRYEMIVDGHICVADYYRRGDELVVTHVATPPELRGQGLAAQLMKAVVDDAKAKGLKIVPVCSYAAAYLQRHPQ